jgi:hypothetical protein
MTKFRITPVEAQRRRLEALARWFKFVKGEWEVTPENFNDELLFPTYRALGGRGYSPGGPPSQEDIDEVRQLIMKGFDKLAAGDEWFVTLERLGISITRNGMSYEAPSKDLGQLGAAQLLRNEEWRIGRCAWCEERFLKKKRGEYCGRNCSQRMRTERARDPKWASKEADARKLGLPAAIMTGRKRATSNCPAGCGAATFAAESTGGTRYYELKRGRPRLHSCQTTMLTQLAK